MRSLFSLELFRGIKSLYCYFDHFNEIQSFVSLLAAMQTKAHLQDFNQCFIEEQNIHQRNELDDSF